ALRLASTHQTGRFTAMSDFDRGTTKWWDVIVTAVTTTRPHIDYMISTARDVTIFIASCRDREQSLEQERRARLEIEKENRKRDYALLVAAHELGAPLYAVRGWAQYLQLGNLQQEDMTEAIDAINRNTDRQYHLVERLLEVARIRSRRTSFNLVANSLEEILDDAIGCVRAVAGSKQIAIVAAISTPTWVMADFDQLQRAFSNILFNSIKFTPVGGTISVSCATADDRIRIEFTDTGSGMASEFLQKAFEPFTQEPAASPSSSISVGLGLSIVRRIVDGHQGVVRVASRGRGLGTSFVIDLPVFSQTLA
ncbi:MAG TPA: HAMP domain-containing sensor histidine kinase, partial [Steroidobacteraceae bacterium]|nr:HAMP domain-containing sensor histidine kinase [Steroidobacteraceae bacterium]